MSKQTRYLLTVDSATGAAVKLERLGEAGDLTEVPLSSLSVPTAGAAPPPAAPAPQSLVINIFMGGPQQAAPLSISTPGTVGPGVSTQGLSIVGPGGPAPSLSMVGPGGPAPSLSTVGPGGPAPSLAGPGGPGGSGAPPEGPAGPGGPGGGGRPHGGGEGGSR
ncbi:hypothetical protein [Archangium sp.]|uniref:hypothetical protein n=1 Tax=Archangium sp. TaxID=1872627 RepID=UPI00389A35A7